MPLVEQLLAERVAVGVTLGVESGARIPVLKPGATQVAIGLEHRGVDPKVGQPLDLIDTGHTPADHDHFVVEHGLIMARALG